MIVSESGQLGVGVGCEMWMWTRKAAVLVDEVEPRTKYRKWSRVVCMQRESLEPAGQGRQRDRAGKKSVAAAGKHKVCSLHTRCGRGKLAT